MGVRRGESDRHCIEDTPSILLRLEQTAVAAQSVFEPPQRTSTQDQDRPVPIRPRNASIGAALSLSGTVLGGLLIGALVGVRWDSNPKAAAIGLFLGIVVGFYNLAKAMWIQR